MQRPSYMNWKLGMFVTLGIALLVAMLFYLGKQKNLFGTIFHIRSVFTNVGGLKIGSNVRLGGINVGTVEGIELITDTSVMVQMVVRGAIHKFIKQDASVNIGSEGLMGDKVLVIVPGTSTAPPITDNSILISKAPVETDQILSSLKISADNAALITRDLAEISDKINHGHGVISKLIGDSALSNNLNRTMVNLKKGSEGLNENMEAAKHNFLLKGFFKKKKKEEDKKKLEVQQAKAPAEEKH